MATLAELPPQSLHSQKKNRIQVSNNKKPLFFYVNLAKRYMEQHNEVELSALGMATATVVTVAEILKNKGLATSMSVSTSIVGLKDGNKGRMIPKARIQIVLGKSEKFDSLVAADVATVEPVGAANVESDATATVESNAAPTVDPDTASTVEPDVATAVEPDVTAAVEPEASAPVEQDASKDEN